MSVPDLFTAAERRLALLLFLLAALGAVVRVGRGVSPEVAAWLDAPEGTQTPSGADSAAAAVAAPRVPPWPAKAPPALLDPNGATREELIALPGIGPALAGRILADREQNGPYRRARDLLRVSGIGPATLNRIKPYLNLP